MDLSKPVVPAPPHYVVDLENPQRRGEAIITWVGIIGMVLATMLLLVRAYTKMVVVKKLASDDLCLFLAWIASMSVQSLIVYRAQAGLIGVHAWELTGHQLNTISRITLTTTVLYSPALALAKMSFLCLYLNINPDRTFRIGVFATTFVVIGSCVGIVISLLSACTPFEKNIDISVRHGECINKTALYIATGIINIVTDLMVLILPIPMVLGLQMVRSRKVMVIMLFSVGSFTCITSAVRVALLPPMLTSKDTSWDTVYPSLWILIEGSLIIITGSLPTTRIFLRHVAPSWIGDDSEVSHTFTSQRDGEAGWELKRHSKPDPYRIGDDDLFTSRGLTRLDSEDI